MYKKTKKKIIVGNSIYKFYLYMVLFSLAFSPLRTFGVFNVQSLNNLLVPLITVVLFFIWLLKLNYKVYVDRLTLSLLLMFFQGLIVGIFREANLYYLLSDLFAIFAALFTYNVCSLLQIKVQDMIVLLSRISKLIVFLSSIVIATDYIITYFFQSYSYLSYGDYLALIPFSYFLFYRNKLLLFLTVGMIFFGAKVGAMISAIGIFFTYLLLTKARKLSPGILIIIVVILLSFSTFLLYYFRSYEPETHSLFGDIIAKIQGYNYFYYNQANVNTDNYGAGRMIEITSSLQAFSILPGLPYLFGAGAGFTYEANRFGAEIHNVHLSIVNIFEKHGIILAILFYVEWLRALYKSYKITLRTIDVQAKKLSGVMCCFCVGAFIFSFTAFSIFVVLSSWFFLGFINRLEYQQNLLLKS